MQHLSIEQCKSLKSLGFPQITTLGWYENKRTGYSIDHGGMPDLYVACPTLENLIEWLGDTIISITQETEVAWSAKDNKGISHWATNPLEAVYNLACAVKGNHE